MQGKWVRKPKSESSVVFLHGILSSGESCWRHENGSYWPELLKNESELAALGIYVFTYQTGVFSGNYRLGEVVDDLKEHMGLDGLFDSKRIIFVCHSMGGIVARKFLVERNADLIEKKIEIGLFLVASPSLGSSYANWLSPLAKFLGHVQADALRFQQENAWLNDLDREFQNMKEAGRLKIKGKELIEDKSIILRQVIQKQVVEYFSGARYFGEPYKVPKSDHFSIAKPHGKSAVQHRLLCKFIKELTPRQTLVTARSRSSKNIDLKTTTRRSLPISPTSSVADAGKQLDRISDHELDESGMPPDLALLNKAIYYFNALRDLFYKDLILPSHCDAAYEHLNNIFQCLRKMVEPSALATGDDEPLTVKQISIVILQHTTEDKIIDLMPRIKTFRSICHERNSKNLNQKLNIQRKLGDLEVVLQEMHSIYQTASLR